MERARKITIDLIGNISDMWEFINPPNVGGSVLGIRPESGYGAWYGPTSQGK
jgi:hypothetical protein